MNKAILNLLCLSLGTTSVFSLQIAPIPIEIKADAKYAELTLSQDKGQYQVFVKKWRQDENGTDILEDTNDIVVFPKLFSIPKTVKVYKKAVFDPNIESSYRIFLKELAVKEENSTGNFARIVKTLSLPVFVRPSTSKTNIITECINNKIVIKNNGNTHLRITEISGKQIIEYILPKSQKIIDIEFKGIIKTNNGELIMPEKSECH